MFPLAWGEGNESNKPLYNNWHCEYVSPRVGEGNERLPSGSGSSNEMVFPLALGEGNDCFSDIDKGFRLALARGMKDLFCGLIV